MNMMKTSLILGSLVLGFSAGCSSEDGREGGSSGGPAGNEFDPQVPPTTKEGILDWLEAFETEGWESQWSCEPEATEKTSGAAAIHAHGTTNRVCSNQKLAAAELAAGAELEKGVASLKYVASGIYVMVKAEEDSADGNGWYFFSPGGSVADFGASACVSCHGAAGGDDDHPGLGDYVYFRVQ